MPLSNVSVSSYSFSFLTTSFVTGNIMISYPVLSTICTSISFSISVMPIPQNAIGKNMSESTVSPATDDTIALSENRLPPDTTFIRLMI